MARNIINEIILSKVKEVGIVKLINKFIPDKYLVITEDSSHYIEPLSGKILFGYEVENIFKKTGSLLPVFLFMSNNY